VKIDFEKNYFIVMSENEENKKEIEFDLRDIAVIEIKNLNILSDKIDRSYDENMEIGNELFI
jgi:hypothetical protein